MINTPFSVMSDVTFIDNIHLIGTENEAENNIHS